MQDQTYQRYLVEVHPPSGRLFRQTVAATSLAHAMTQARAMYYGTVTVSTAPGGLTWGLLDARRTDHRADAAEDAALVAWMERRR